MRNPIVKAALKSDLPVRVYALNGMALSYANEVEDAMFWAYFQISGQPFEIAANKFYERVNFGTKAAAVDEVVKDKLAGTEHEKAWFELIKRIRGLLGHGSKRNLIGHNVVSTGLFDRSAREGGAIKLDLAIRQYVSQKRPMVETGKRLKQTLDEDGLAAYCEDLIDLFRDLDAFLSGPLELDPKHPERYSHVYWEA